MNFKNLHNQESPLIIANVWDVPSAKLAEKLNFQAIGTSSAAIASLLGYEDGENIDFSELLYIVEKISKHTKLPLSVDLEAGYAKEPKDIAENIKKLTQLGVVGINIEDSIVSDTRTLYDANLFSKQLIDVTDILKEDNVEVFINVRIDTFILGVEEKIKETKKRIELYREANIDGFFVPCIENINDITEIVNHSDLPLNVMCMPNLPSFDELNKIGVKRISMGNFLFDSMYNYLEKKTSVILENQSFKSVFS